jgi:hypothetical protein
MLMRMENFDAVRENIGVQVRALNLVLRSAHTSEGARGVHTHNNGAQGVCSISKAQRSLVGVHANVGKCWHVTT